MSKLTDTFGSMVFDDREMKSRLPANVYYSLKKTIDEGAQLDIGVANAVADAMGKKGYSFVSAQIEMVPGEYKKLENEEDIANMEKMLDIFEDDDDVQNVWHNWDRD